MVVVVVVEVVAFVVVVAVGRCGRGCCSCVVVAALCNCSENTMRMCVQVLINGNHGVRRRKAHEKMEHKEKCHRVIDHNSKRATLLDYPTDMRLKELVEEGMAKASKKAADVGMVHIPVEKRENPALIANDKTLWAKMQKEMCTEEDLDQTGYTDRGVSEEAGGRTRTETAPRDATETSTMHALSKSIKTFFFR